MVGMSEGVSVGEWVGRTEGNAVLGEPLWLDPSANVGYVVVGTREGDFVGESVGVSDGATVGTWVGVRVGKPVGDIEGYAELGAPVWVEPLANVGCAVDGSSVGEAVGVAVGAKVGSSDGVQVGA